MDFMPESTAITNRDQAHQIITRKRTDHKRPKSPIATTSNSFTNHNTVQSSEEEEEDMANCLIMLAHGVSPLNDDKFENFCGRKPEKLKIRSVTEMTATTGIGYSGTQCYECKTCNRVFPSFQALGGHRASHKKPKLTLDDDKPEYPKEYQPKLVLVYEDNKTVTNNKLTSSVVADHFVQTGYKNSQAKVHQCSICGSEFLSGQALGGHMRRHRTAPPSLSPTTTNDHFIEKSPVLSLDLNLPPPEVADDGHLSFQFAGGSSQQPLVFSAPALVDCHY